MTGEDMPNIRKNSTIVNVDSSDIDSDWIGHARYAGYSYKNCQSLFGYAEKVHRRSGGICQLCGCGSGKLVDFDFWRQMTVEHLIGKSQGGYLTDIRKDVYRIFPSVFPSLVSEVLDDIVDTIDEANTVTACSFCNSTTSRKKNDRTMGEILEATTGTIDERVEQVRNELEKVFDEKKREVQYKLMVIRKAFEKNVKPELQRKRYKDN